MTQVEFDQGPTLHKNIPNCNSHRRIVSYLSGSRVLIDTNQTKKRLKKLIFGRVMAFQSWLFSYGFEKGTCSDSKRIALNVDFDNISKIYDYFVSCTSWSKNEPSLKMNSNIYSKKSVIMSQDAASSCHNTDDLYYVFTL